MSAVEGCPLSGVPLYTVAELIVSAIDNLKMMAGEHAVHEQQAILLTTVIISRTFCTIKKNEKELIARGMWQ